MTAVGDTPTGTVIMFSDDFPVPMGWLIADGSKIDPTTDRDLLNVLGKTYARGPKWWPWRAARLPAPVAPAPGVLMVIKR